MWVRYGEVLATLCRMMLVWSSELLFHGPSKVFAACQSSGQPKQPT